MIVKCMRPQNPNFSEEKMGLISAKKSIKTMVPYNGPALVEGSVLVGRTFRNHAKAWFFCAQISRTCMLFPTIRLGRTFRNPRGYLGGFYKAITTIF